MMPISEVTVGLLNHSADDGSVKLTARRSFGNIIIDASAPGQEFELMIAEVIGEFLDTGYA
ncbi:MAG: hypothetical protein K6E34_00045, partial [Lachnospiraceae bacterium]|nr:hypothetical protein [Lachnospiraceae bacterium]